MTTITKYPQGAPSWIDLATSDGEGAKKFYTGLFGWEIEDSPVAGEENMVYTMYKVPSGHYVAASFNSDPEQGPPRWQIYFTVYDLEDAIERVKAAGGKVVAGPMDVMGAGDMAVVQDPQGAFFQLWQPKQHRGAGVKDEPNSACWFELSTTDTTAAAEFYTKVLQCTLMENPLPADDPTYHLLNYRLLAIDDMPHAGMMEIQPDWGEVPPHWGVYLGVSNIESGLAKLKELGGTQIADVQTIPQGKFAMVKDPQGAYFSLFEVAQHS